MVASMSRRYTPRPTHRTAGWRSAAPCSGPGAPRQQHGQQRQRQEQEQEDRGTEDHRRGRKRVASESRAVLLVPDRKSYVNSM